MPQPPGVPVDNSTRYTAQSLLGLLAAVDREIYDVFDKSTTGCTAGEDAHAFACSPASFATSDAGGDPTRYMLDLFSQVGCASHRTVPAAKHYAYSTGESPRCSATCCAIWFQ